MILGFKSRFKGMIINGQKIHTIREDHPDRWKAGDVIHFATGVRTKFYNQFWYGHCKNVQRIVIGDSMDPFDKEKRFYVYVDGRKLDKSEIKELFRNDGFDSSKEFFDWFLSKTTTFEGKLIHWTDKIY